VTASLWNCIGNQSLSRFWIHCWNRFYLARG